MFQSPNTSLNNRLGKVSLQFWKAGSLSSSFFIKRLKIKIFASVLLSDFGRRDYGYNVHGGPRDHRLLVIWNNARILPGVSHGGLPYMEYWWGLVAKEYSKLSVNLSRPITTEPYRKLHEGRSLLSLLNSDEELSPPACCNISLFLMTVYFLGEILDPGGVPTQKGQGCFKSTPGRNQDHVLWTWLENVLTPKRYKFQNSIRTISI